MVDHFDTRKRVKGAPRCEVGGLYESAILVCMVKKTFNVDPKLLKAAREAVGGATATDTIRLGLEALVRHAAYQRMRDYLGSESNLAVPAESTGSVTVAARQFAKPASPGRGAAAADVDLAHLRPILWAERVVRD